MTRLFVYGTLKKGFCREHYLADETFVRTTSTASGYILFDCGSYPALAIGGHDFVFGELYEVQETTMRILDRVEAVDEGLYERGTVKLYDGEVATAYFYRLKTDQLPVAGREWTKR